MCRVCNRRTYRGRNGRYIGRGSDWGNPFRIGADGDRSAVIRKHEVWLAGQHDLLKRLDELKGYDLLCFCAPLACHGDLLARLATADREDRITWWRRAKAAAVSAP